MSNKTNLLIMILASVLVFGAIAGLILLKNDPNAGIAEAAAIENTNTVLKAAASPVLRTDSPVRSASMRNAAGATPRTSYIIVKSSEKPLPVLISDPPPAVSSADLPQFRPDPSLAVNSTPDFDLVAGAPVPEGFLVPEIKFHFNEGEAYSWYFKFSIDNLKEYQKSPGMYRFRTICLNYPVLNSRQIMNANGTESEPYDCSMWTTLDQTMIDRSGSIPIIYIMPVKWYATIAEEMKFKLLPGMRLEFAFQITDGSTTLEYRKAIILNDMKFN